MEKKKKKKEKFKEIIIRTSKSSENINLHMQESEQISTRMNTRKLRPVNLIKLLTSKGKIFSNKKKWHIPYKGILIWMMADYSSKKEGRKTVKKQSLNF